MMMHMVGAFAEFERDMIRERTREGLENAGAEGHIGGRPLGSPAAPAAASSARSPNAHAPSLSSL
jgi:DNA invertase Pin-like site-specific DNA recombinase